MVGRAVVICLLLLSSFPVFSQKYPVIYGGLDYFRNVGFEGNAYWNLHFGSQVYEWKFLAPEIGIDYYSGSPVEQNYNFDDPQSIPEAKLKSRFSSFTFSLAPKLKFGDQEAALVIIPRYNFGTISSRGDHLFYNGNLYALEERSKYSEPASFWSFAAGIEGDFLGTEYLWFSLLLKYSLLDSENALHSLDFSDHRIRPSGGSSSGIGIGFRVYVDIISIFKE